MSFQDGFETQLGPSWTAKVAKMTPGGPPNTGAQRTLSGAQHTLLALKRPQQPKRLQEASKTPKMTLQVAKMTLQVAKMTPPRGPQEAKMSFSLGTLAKS